MKAGYILLNLNELEKRSWAAIVVDDFVNKLMSWAAIVVDDFVNKL